MRALIFVIGTLLQLVVTVFLLRVLLPLARADARNQLSQAVIRLTNRSCCRCGKLLPPIGKVDTASIVALVLVQLPRPRILWSLRAYPWVFTPPQFFLVVLGSLLGTILHVLHVRAVAVRAAELGRAGHLQPGFGAGLQPVRAAAGARCDA